jgi:hypothetical protein
MNYVVAGYVIVLTTLSLYGVQLVWRRKRLTEATRRVESSMLPGEGGPAPERMAGDQ